MNWFCRSWVARARDRIHFPGYYQERLWDIAKELDYWNHFRKFECSEFFRGSLRAKLNKRKHDKAVSRLKAKAEWYEKKIEEIHG